MRSKRSRIPNGGIVQRSRGGSGKEVEDGARKNLARKRAKAA
jgi:hypothetical protein